MAGTDALRGPLDGLAGGDPGEHVLSSWFQMVRRWLITLLKMLGSIGRFILSLKDA